MIVRIKWSRSLLLLSVVIIGFPCLVSCAKHPSGPLRDVSAEDIEHLRSWALQVDSQNSTNIPEGAAYLFVSKQWPEGLRHIRPTYSEWRAMVFPPTSNDARHISLVSMGGFASEQIVIGTTNFSMPTNRQCQRVAAGVYVSWSGH